jgi:hypothetical protein
MADSTNLGTLLKLSTSGSGGAYTAVAGVTKLTPPAIKNPAVESTNHNSPTYKTWISGGQVELTPIKSVISMDKSVSGSMVGYATSGSVYYWQVVFPNSQTWQFQGLLTEFTPGDADAQKPDMLQATCTIQPSGSMIMS